MFCPICGNEMPSGARFCPACGGTTEPPEALSQDTGGFQMYGATPTPMPTPGVGVVTQVMEAPPASPAEPARKAGLSSRNKGLIAGLGGALAVILAVVAVMSFASPANAVAIDEDEFPDPVFRAYVAENLDANRDGRLSQDEIDSVTTIDISNVARDDARVSDLTGIGHFRGLHTLNASHCDIRRMPPDFGHLHELRVCDLSYCQIDQTINVTENYNLIVVYVGGNQPGTTIEADPTTNVVTDPAKSIETDPDLPKYRGGQNDEPVDPADLEPAPAPAPGEGGSDDQGEPADGGGEPADGEGGTATTGGGEGEGSITTEDDPTEDDPIEGEPVDAEGNPVDGGDVGSGSNGQGSSEAANGEGSDGKNGSDENQSSSDQGNPLATENAQTPDTQSTPGGNGDTATTPGDDNQGEESADQETLMRQSVEESASREIRHWFYGDFDKDGSYEAFAIIGDDDPEFMESEQAWRNGEIWFVNGDGAKQIGDSNDGNQLNGMYEDPVSGDALLSIEKNAHGSGTTSTVYTVQGGTWKKVGADMEPLGAVKVQDGRIVGYTSSFDEGYHEYLTYELEYDPSTAMLHATNLIDQS